MYGKEPVYGAAVQYSDRPNDPPLLPPKDINCIQQIIGTLLYYAIVINPTMLVALGSIATQKT